MNKVILPILLILFLSINELLFCQITPKSKKNYSIRFNTIGESYAEFEAIHLAPSFTITIGNEKHNFYLGPQYTYLFQHKGNWSRRYEKNSPGLNFGYRLYSSKIMKNTRMLAQFNYSIFEIVHEDYQLGPPFSSRNKETIVENSLSIGTDYEIINKIHLFAGIGFGSSGGFFIFIEKFTFTGFLGVEYKFR